MSLRAGESITATLYQLKKLPTDIENEVGIAIDRLAVGSIQRKKTSDGLVYYELQGKDEKTVFHLVFDESHREASQGS